MKKQQSLTKDEREWEEFCHAVDEFQCGGSQEEFDNVLKHLLSYKASSQPPGSDGRRNPSTKRTEVFPVRCDECYARTELVRDASGYNALWLSDVTWCKHPPLTSCPRIWAAFARAHDQLRGRP